MLLYKRLMASFLAISLNYCLLFTQQPTPYRDYTTDNGLVSNTVYHILLLFYKPFKTAFTLSP